MKNLAFILSILLLLTSCVKNHTGDNDMLGDVVNIKIQNISKAAIDEGINTIRVIVINSNGTVTSNRSIFLNSVMQGDVEARSGLNNFYFICNESSEMTSELSQIKTERDLENYRIKLDSKVVEPLIMFAEMKNVMVRSTGDTSADYEIDYTDMKGQMYKNATVLKVNVEKISSLIEFTVIKNNGSTFNVKGLKMTLLHIPKSSSLKKNVYSEPIWADYDLSAVSSLSLTVDNTATWQTESGSYKFANGNKAAFSSFYLPEHIMTDEHKGDPDYSTLIVLRGICYTTSGDEEESTWIINLMENGNNYEIKRNTNYKIVATIKNKGTSATNPTKNSKYEQEKIIYSISQTSWH